MPRYFFDVNDGESTVSDEGGFDLPDLDAAELEAACTIGEIARDVLNRPSAARKLTVGIRDGTGQQVLEVSLTYAVKSASQGRGAGGE